MTNVIHLNDKIQYDNTPERELEGIWQDIKGKNIQNLSRNLLKTIANNEINVKTLEIQPFAKQMFDSKENEYVPYEFSGAFHIVNDRKETLRMRMYQPLENQNEYGPVIYGWKKYDCTNLQKALEDQKDVLSKILISNKKNDMHSWMQMVKQDQQAYIDEGRYEELPGYKDQFAFAERSSL